MRVALAAITNDGHGFALDQAQITILVVKNFHLNARETPAFMPGR